VVVGITNVIVGVGAGEICCLDLLDCVQLKWQHVLLQQATREMFTMKVAFFENTTNKNSLIT
jgi:hypothetical protein